jgi:hypothetical protein
MPVECSFASTEEKSIDGQQIAPRPPTSACSALSNHQNGQAAVSAVVPWCLRGARAWNRLCAPVRDKDNGISFRLSRPRVAEPPISTQSLSSTDVM